MIDYPSSDHEQLKKRLRASQSVDEVFLQNLCTLHEVMSYHALFLFSRLKATAFEFNFNFSGYISCSFSTSHMVT